MQANAKGSSLVPSSTIALDASILQGDSGGLEWQTIVVAAKYRAVGAVKNNMMTN